MEIPSIFLNRILTESVRKNASTVHFSVGGVPVLRIDDRLVPMDNENILAAEIIEKIADSFLSDDEKKKLEGEKEIILVKNFAGSFRFLIKIFYQKDLLSLSFRNIPAIIKNPNELNLPKVLNSIINLDSGLFIIAGPQLSGKTTTAAALVEEVNKSKGKRILTVENPIEFLFVGKKSIIEQRQVGKDVKSFALGIENCIDEDADLVYLSELKEDFDSVLPLVLDLASGNALVLLELNTENTIRVVEKMLNSLEKKMNSEAARYSLADTLSGIIVQRLLPRMGGGMVPATEVLIANSAVKSLIREGRIYQLESIIQTSRKEGMISMGKSIEELTKTGEIKQNSLKIN